MLLLLQVLRALGEDKPRDFLLSDNGLSKLSKLLMLLLSFFLSFVSVCEKKKKKKNCCQLIGLKPIAPNKAILTEKNDSFLFLHENICCGYS